MVSYYSPGVSVMQGIGSANQAFSGMLSNVNTLNQLREWDRQEGVRSLLRDIAYDQALTRRETEAQSNKALRALGKVRDSLYDGSKDGYMKALDMVSPLANGQTRRLSSDGKSIETVGLDGTVLGITPNYSGKMAERAMLQNYGMDILRERDIFFDREARDQMANLQLASMQNSALNKQNEMLMSALMKGLSGGGQGSGGGRGGKGDSDKDGFEDMSSSDMARIFPMLQTEAALAAGIPIDAQGRPDLSTADPEAIGRYRAYSANLQHGMMQGIYANNLPQPLAYYTAVQNFLGGLNRAQAQQKAAVETRQRRIKEATKRADEADSRTPTALRPDNVILGDSPMGRGLTLFLNPAYNNAL